MSKEALYQERLARIERTIRLEAVDRLPIVYQGVAFAPRYMGMSMARFCADPEAAFAVTLAAVDRLGDLDGINSLGIGRVEMRLSPLWLSRVALPGRELPEDSLWQVQEAELMSVEDYDVIAEQGWPAFVAGYLPKILDPGEFLANQQWANERLPAAVRETRERGYAIVSSGGTAIPFEFLCGGRSMKQFLLDLHRVPDRVQAAMDAMTPALIQLAVGTTELSGVPGVWVGGWRAASSLISPRLWNRFVFPYYVEMVNALAERGIVSVLHFDQDWTRDLARLRELPAKKCILNLDGMTDIRKAKELLGDHMALMGDIPPALLVAGTPDDVYRYVRDLVRDVGPIGLILCPGCDAPINARPENMEAFVAACRDFGSARG